MKTSCLTPRISANMFPTHQKDPLQILNNKSAPCQSLTHQINVTGRTNSLASPCRSDSVELTAVCDFCRGTGITSLFCLLIKVKHLQAPKPGSTGTKAQTDPVLVPSPLQDQRGASERKDHHLWFPQTPT